MGKTSHKATDLSENVVMRLYYQKDVLTFMCCVNEAFYISLYVLHFTSGPIRKFFNNFEKNIEICLKWLSFSSFWYFFV